MAGTSFLDLMTARTLEGLKRELIAINKAFGNPVNTWIPGEPTERWLDLTPRMIYAVLAGITTQAVRGFFLDLTTDPGDPGDLSADQTPRPGFLSAFGEGWWGTTRRGQTYSTTTVVLKNNGSTTSLPFKPFDLTFTTVASPGGPLGGGEAAKSDGGRPTFRNTADNSVYTGLGGTLTLAPGASATIPVACEQIGTYGSVSANSLVCVTGSFGTLITTSSALAIGSAREDADLYRERCKTAPAKFSTGGPEEKYKRAATTNADGTPLQRYDDSGPVGITKSYFSMNSLSNVVRGYFADDDGAADAVDVDSANANITGVALGVITDPQGAVAECTTYIGAAATETTITVVGTATIKRVKGMSDSDLKAAAEAASDAAIVAYFKRTDIGGNNQTAGAGVVATSDLVAASGSSYPGLHGVALSSPATSTTSIAVGHVAKLAGSTPYVTVTVVA